MCALSHRPSSAVLAGKSANRIWATDLKHWQQYRPQCAVVRVLSDRRRTGGCARYSVIVIFKLMADGRDNDVFLVNDLEQRNIAGSAKRNDQLTKKWARPHFAASER